MEEKWEEFKEGVKKKKDAAKLWCHEHSGEIITIFGGVCTVVGAVVNFCTKKYEEDTCVYTVTDNGNVYRIKAKKLPKAGKSYDDETEEE